MIRTTIAVALLLLATTMAADARARVRITTPEVLPVHARTICTYVAWSVAPDWPQAQQAMMLGRCPPRASYRYL